jgi:hypothetical protein
MLQALPIVSTKTASGAKVRVLPQAQYDSEVTGTGGITELAFFANPLGGAMSNGGAKKTLGDTNVRQNGQLGSPLEFDLIGFNIKVNSAAANTAITPGDLVEVINNSFFEFAFNNRPFLQVPTNMIPHGVGPEGFNGFATGAAINQMPINGIGHRSNLFKFLVGKFRVRIRSTENFSARIVWPVSMVPTVSIKCCVILQGYLYNAI